MDIAAASISEVATPDGLGRVRVIAGEALGARAVVRTHRPITYLHVRLDAGGHVDLSIPSGHTAAVYVFDGRMTVAGVDVGRGQLAILGAGETVSLDAAAGAQALVLGGEPLHEPIAWGGPFVMNTRPR